MKKVIIKNKIIKLPIFLPDATRGYVKSLDNKDILNTKTYGLMVNTYHIMQNPGLEVVKKAGGIKKYMNFDGLISSDSGGWQMYSLIHKNNNAGKITDLGVEFIIGNGKKGLITPEDIIIAQFDLDSDIMICLDDFSPPNKSEYRVKQSVQRTIYWAKRSKIEFEKQLKLRGFTNENRPILLSPVQGGYDKDLRKYCCEELIKIGFDAYGFGGYVVDSTGNWDMNMSEFLVNLLPNNSLKFALGIGRISDVYKLSKMGWDLFDCTLPTRDARHKRIYILNETKNDCSYLYFGKSKNINNFNTIDNSCDCLTCKNYSVSYINHLFNTKDPLALRLASIHNLRTYSRLIESLHELR